VKKKIVKLLTIEVNIAPCNIFLDNDNQHSMYVPLASKLPFL